MKREFEDCCIAFEVLTAVGMKSSISRDITPCSPLTVSRRFGEKCYLHLQNPRISQAINHLTALLATSFMLVSFGYFFDAENGDKFLRNVG
jgi:hypothetical protein